MLTIVGHFVLSPRKREKRNRKTSRQERNREGYGKRWITVQKQKRYYHVPFPSSCKYSRPSHHCTAQRGKIISYICQLVHDIMCIWYDARFRFGIGYVQVYVCSFRYVKFPYFSGGNIEWLIFFDEEIKKNNNNNRNLNTRAQLFKASLA